jgi:hypothetical protein
MASQKSTKQPLPKSDTDQIPLGTPPLEEPFPTSNDPGGAHAKGYSADPRPEQSVAPEGPLPLAAVADDGSHVQQPVRDGQVRPTGRAEPSEYMPNDRLMGSDR